SALLLVVVTTVGHLIAATPSADLRFDQKSELERVRALSFFRLSHSVALGLRFDGRVSRHRLSKRCVFFGGETAFLRRNLLQNARMQSGVLHEFFGRAAIESVDQEKPSKSAARLVSSIKPARFIFAVGTASIILAVVSPSKG